MRKNIVAQIVADLIAIKKAALEGEIDRYIRAKILGLLAGEPSWEHTPARGFQEAQAKWPEIHPIWIERRDTGLYSAVIQAAFKITRNREEAEDIASKILGNQTVRFHRGVKIEGGALEYTVREVKKSIPDSGPTSSNYQRIKALLLSHAAQKATDVIRSQIRQEEHRRFESPFKVRVTPGEVEEGVAYDAPSYSSYTNRNLDTALADVLTERSPFADDVRDWIKNIWSQKARPADAQKGFYILDNPEKKGSRLKDDLGVSDSYISQVKKRLLGIIYKELQHPTNRTTPTISKNLEHHIIREIGIEEYLRTASRSRTSLLHDFLLDF